MTARRPSERSGAITLTGLRADTALRRLVRWVFVAGVFGALATGVGGLALYAHLSRDLPSIEALADWAPPGVTQLRADDTRVVAELTRERRYIVPLERVPRRLIEAFLSAEDQRFFEHRGVDWRGVVRAALANWRAGRVVEGASTLTQQVCKGLVGNERSLVRKAREAILARRLEARLDKLDILAMYLNAVYLGHGAYGVQAAARAYFGQDVSRLTLGQAATLAGLPPQPSTLNPVVDPEGTRARRAWVLQRMVTEGFVSPDEARAAETEPVVAPEAARRVDIQGAADYAEHARRTLQATYGAERLLTEALTVHLAVDADLQTEASEALRAGLVGLGERQGYVGPIAHVSPAEAMALRGRAAAHYGAFADTPRGDGEVDPWRVAVVERVDAREARVRVGDAALTVPLPQARWAAPWRAGDAVNGRVLKRLDDALRTDDVVWVRLTSTRGVARLAQVPPVQGAVTTVEPVSGAVRALVGGFDFGQSEYNRAFQGCRQPGSAFKPIAYARAFEQGLTLATPLSDAPLTEFDPVNQLLWKPRNANGQFSGDVPAYLAFARSLNLPAIKVLDFVGADAAVALAHQLGISTPMYPDRSLVLGSSCVLPWDLTQAFAAFALRGERARPVFIKRVETRDGRLLEDRTHVSDAWAPMGPRLDALLRAALEPRDRVLSAAAGYLTQTALAGVVERGTGTAARALGVRAGGKTGTTDAFDAWFVGFTRDVVTTVWLGSDRNDRPLGRGETGGEAALPVWSRIMRAALAGRPPADFLAAPPSEVEFADIDLESGRLAGAGRPRVHLPFMRGSVPVEAAPEAGAVDRRDLNAVEGRF